uniref:SMAP domain-containing protein n=1 Tax=Heterorhabditis bacteriophora TaxID=37862 RepID=A0A1I7XSN6_HETBA
MFRKPTKKPQAQVRKRNDNSSENDEDDVEVIKDTVKRRRRVNPMIQSTKKRDRCNEPLSSTSDEGESDQNIVAEHAFAASGSSEPLGPKDQEHTTDAQAQFERVQQQLKEGLEKDGKILYKGQAMYGAKEAKDSAKGNASSGMNRIGS